MPYTSHNWINGDSASATRLNNLESQYTESSLSFEPDQFNAGFVVTGYAASGSVGTTTVTVAAGTAYLLQTDGTTRQRKLTSSTQTTSTPSTTYHLYLQPDGTWFWSTAGSGQAANSLHIADVATNGSGQISTITDFRPLNPVLFPSLSSYLETPALVFGGLATLTSTPALMGAIYVATGANQLIIDAPLSGATNGTGFGMWNGSSRVFPFSLGAQIGSAPTWLDQSGIVKSVAGQASAGSFGVPVIVAQAIATHVTLTSQQTILTFTPSATGNYRISFDAYVFGTTPATVSAEVDYIEGNAGNAAVMYPVVIGQSSTTISVLHSLSVSSANFLQGLTQTIYAQTGNAITCKYTNATATPNDNVTFIIERIS